MIRIRPLSDLRNKFPEIEKMVVKDGEAVYLTKNGHGSMVVMSLEKYSELIDGVQIRLDEADQAAAASDLRLSHNEVFDSIREKYGI